MAFPNSLFRLLALGRPVAPSPARERRNLEQVRARMLALLARHEGAAFYRVAERIRYADALESLWYLRQDLLTALSAVHGEAAARREVAPLNALFKGVLPQALTAPLRQRAPH